MAGLVRKLPINYSAQINSNRESDAIDIRFRALLDRDDWNALPDAVQQRFSKLLTGDRQAIYEGRTTDLRMNRAGWFLAQFLRLVGAPLPVACATNAPSLVCVSEDTARDGQVWSRIYGRDSRFPQVIHSIKSFSGPTGLEEYIGFGVSIALKISVKECALVFSSDAYHLHIFSRRIRMPQLFSPGQLTVTHKDEGGGEFRFSLSLNHPLLGELVFQSGLYCDLLSPTQSS